MRIEYWEGIFSMKDKFYFMSQQEKNQLFNPDYDTIQDFRKAILPTDLDEIKKLRYYHLKNQVFNGVRKIAQLCDTPNTVVYSMSLQFLKSKRQIEIKPFSTLKAACSWLELDSVDELSVEIKLKNFRLKEL